MKHRLVLAAIAINALFGTLYGWSLFLRPLESLLAATLAALSLVPALAIVGFTAGMLVHDRLIRRFGAGRTGAAALVLGGLGHLPFWLWRDYASLLLGYGGLFGLANGVGYGVAVALARAATASGRGELIGLPIAAYAATGIVMSAAVSLLGQVDSPPRLLGAIGLALVAAGLLLGLVLGRSPPPAEGGEAEGGEAARPPGARPGEGREFRRIAFGFFTLCFLGLTFVSHATAILAEKGRPGDGTEGLSTWAPLLLNSGYIVGALLGGSATRWLPAGAAALLALACGALAALGVLLLPAVAAPLAALAVVGAAFGSSAAVFFLVLTARFAAGRSGLLFGRLMIGYGTAGLLAPAAAGYLRDATQGYLAPVLVAVVLALLGMAAMTGLRAMPEQAQA